MKVNCSLPVSFFYNSWGLAQFGANFSIDGMDFCDFIKFEMFGNWLAWFGLACHLPEISSVSSGLCNMFGLSGPNSAFLSALRPLLPFVCIVTISI